MIVVPFLPCHLKDLVLQKAQIGFGELIKNEDYASILFHGGEAYTGIDGEILVCAGILKFTENRAQAWALVSPLAGGRMARITSEVRTFLDAQTIRRIETPVKTDFEQGHRWMKVLGFEREGTMKAYDDGDYDLYARVR